jgi:hypothetical protein
MARATWSPGSSRDIHPSKGGKYQRDRSPSPGRRHGHGGGHSVVRYSRFRPHPIPISSSITARLFFPPGGGGAEHACTEERSGANNPRSAASRRRPTTKPKQNGRPLCLPGRPPLFLSHQAAVPLDSSVGVGECEITSQRAGRRRRSVKQRSSSGRGPRAPPARAWAA